MVEIIIYKEKRPAQPPLYRRDWVFVFFYF